MLLNALHILQCGTACAGRNYLVQALCCGTEQWLLMVSPFGRFVAHIAACDYHVNCDFLSSLMPWQHPWPRWSKSQLRWRETSVGVPSAPFLSTQGLACPEVIKVHTLCLGHQ